MRRRSLGLFMAGILTLTACGIPGEQSTPAEDSEGPLLQVRSEGGFAPPELLLGRGPTYTLTSDGRLVHQGPVAAIYPGPLVPEYVVAPVSEGEMGEILELVGQIGLPDMVEESDDEHGLGVADATTEVVTYWDEQGTHVYSVYALGIDPSSPNPATAAFQELLALLDEIASAADAVPYEADLVQVVGGVAMAPIDPEFEDTRDWPLDGEDPADWDELPNGWLCTTQGAEVLAEFEDARQTTQWLHPDPMMDAPPFTLLVRPLHPGESPCAF